MLFFLWRAVLSLAKCGGLIQEVALPLADVGVTVKKQPVLCFVFFLVLNIELIMVQNNLETHIFTVQGVQTSRPQSI